MKHALHISARFDQPEFLQQLVERLACRRYDLGYLNEPLPGEWKALEISSTETYVSGTLGIDFGDDQAPVQMPFITCFLFTCTRDAGTGYQLNWSASLS